MPGVPGACPSARTPETPTEPMAASTGSASTRNVLAPALLILVPGLRYALILFRRTQRNSWRGAFAPRHDARRMRFTEAGQPFLRHLRLAHVEPTQPGQLVQPREGFIADRCVREIQARQIAKRFEVWRRGVVDALHVPQAQTTQIPQVRERLQPVRRDRGAAHIQVLQLFELR